MSLMGKVNTNEMADVSTEEKDTLGGGGGIKDTGIYPFEIQYAYVIESKGGALGLSLHLKDADGNQVRFNGAMGSIYFTNKSKEPFYVKDGQKNMLPGAQLVNSLAQATLEEDFFNLDTEEKTINLYSFDEQREVPTKVEMLMPLIGQQFFGAIQRITEDKKQADNNGDYIPTGETRDKNELVKVFNVDRMTQAELKTGEDIPEEELFYSKWLAKNEGKTIDKTDKSAGARTGAPNQPAASGQAAPAKAAAPQKKLFGNN